MVSEETRSALIQEVGVLAIVQRMCPACILIVLSRMHGARQITNKNCVNFRK